MFLMLGTKGLTERQRAICVDEMNTSTALNLFVKSEKVKKIQLQGLDGPM